MSTSLMSNRERRAVLKEQRTHTHTHTHTHTQAYQQLTANLVTWIFIDT